ncbi:MAG TPA: hypothetical protein VMS17_18045 [Gemmataceae bacterium]|nr:hypothetical protein [Gemmataceae bacterium]
MSEQWGRETPESQTPPRKPDEPLRDERTHPPEEFRSYSLESLAVLEG